MKINGKSYQGIWLDPENEEVVCIIDQRWLPHELVIERLESMQDAAVAIQEMHTRGAPMVGMTAAFGLYLAALEIGDAPGFDEQLMEAARILNATRPTAVNLAWAIEQQLLTLDQGGSNLEKTIRLRVNAIKLAMEDAHTCRLIGEHGLKIIQELALKKPGETINILTHCNAGWLATVDYGTATAPIYLAHDMGLPVHVWVDETRPRNQGARLTAYELAEHGVPHTVITDNLGGHLMQHGMVDIVIVGSDRTTYTGDVANKIGTYLKALAAKDNGVPFYVALPESTFDWTMEDGVRDIPIEERDASEVTHIQGVTEDGTITTVRLTPAASPGLNYGFDVTPARLITGLITERGVCEASEAGIFGLYPERGPIA